MMNRGTHQHDDDKLSHLPDCVLVHILSFLNLKEAVRTGSLSKRWKHLWKGLQTLSFNGICFNNYNDFTEFANQVLSLHDPSTAITALDFLTRFPISPHLLETASRNQNLKRLSLFSCCIKKIPNFLYSCHSLESLKLECRIIDLVVFPDSLNLPALTYLNILGLVFCSGDDRCAKPFSGFNRLNSLIIKDCRCEKYSQTLCISNVMLVDLVIDYMDSKSWNIELSAPSLCLCTFFSFNTYSSQKRQKLYGSFLSCVKHVRINHDYCGGVAPKEKYPQNLKQLNLFYCGDGRIPNYLFSCHSLESLTLAFGSTDSVVFPDSLNLPALTYLYLRELAFRTGDDGRVKPFSGFNRLNSLIIKDCRVKEYSQTLCISNAMLVDLVIDSTLLSKIELSAPSLCTFTFKASYLLKLYGSSLSCVKHVSIDGHAGGFSNGVIPTLLIELVNMESPTISSETIWALSYIPDSDLLKSKHTSLSNLKSLQVILCSHEQYPRNEFLHKQILIMMRDVNHEVAGGKPWKGNVKLREAIKALKAYAFIPRVIDFLIQNSPSANVDILIPKQPNGYYFL